MSTNINKDIVNESNSFLTASNASCSSTCSNTIENSTIIILGSGGQNLTVEQNCSNINANCSFNSNIETMIQNIINQQSQQNNTASTGIFGNLFEGFQGAINYNDLEVTLTNYVTNLTNSTCNASSQNLVSNSVLVITAGKQVNDIIQNGSDVSAVCTLQNTIKLGFAQQVGQKTDQENKQKKSSILIIFIVLIVVIAVVIVLVLLAKSGGGKKGSMTEAQNQDILTQAVQIAQKDLGGQLVV